MYVNWLGRNKYRVLLNPGFNPTILFVRNKLPRLTSLSCLESCLLTFTLKLRIKFPSITFLSLYSDGSIILTSLLDCWSEESKSNDFTRKKCWGWGQRPLVTMGTRKGEGLFMRFWNISRSFYPRAGCPCCRQRVPLRPSALWLAANQSLPTRASSGKILSLCYGPPQPGRTRAHDITYVAIWRVAQVQIWPFWPSSPDLDLSLTNASIDHFLPCLSYFIC